MGVLGGKSGFRTGRDLALFIIGAVGCGYHLITQGEALQLEVLLFFGGLMGAPYIISKDEKKGG